MTPTLVGRLQTRLLLAVAVGVPVALLLAVLLGGLSIGGALIDLGLFTALGLGWECVYHLVQQRRWNGDWPSLFAMVAGVLEVLVAQPVLSLVGVAPGFGSLMALLGSVAGVSWLAGRGPLSVFLPHWRHQGSRVVPQRLGPPARGTTAAAAPTRAPRASFPKLSLPRPRGLAGAGFRPTRQQLVVLGGLAAMVVGLLLLAPLVGPRDHQAPSMAIAQHSARHSPQQRPGSTVRATTWDTNHRVRPETLTFGAAGIDDTVGDVRLTSTGTLGIPRGGHAAWFAQGAAPGQRGPAVFIGDASGVFARLGQARPGQTFSTGRSDGSVVRFVVDDVVSADAARFPTRRVYGRTLKPQARLISYDTATGRNVIVFAHAVAVSAMATRS